MQSLEALPAQPESQCHQTLSGLNITDSSSSVVDEVGAVLLEPKANAAILEHSPKVE